MGSRLSHFVGATPDPQRLSRKAFRNPQVLGELIEGLSAEGARIKFGCAKALRRIAEQRPELLYPHFDFFVGLLDSENKILQWEAAFVLSCLAAVDPEGRFEAIFDKYFSPIAGPVMITAANVIGGGARVAQVKPHLADRIAAELLKVSRARYQSAECRNVAIGHAILAFDEIFDLLDNPGPARRFVRRQIHNSRPATRRKAEQFLKRRLPHPDRRS